MIMSFSPVSRWAQSKTSELPKKDRKIASPMKNSKGHRIDLNEVELDREELQRWEDAWLLIQVTGGRFQWNEPRGIKEIIKCGMFYDVAVLEVCSLVWIVHLCGFDAWTLGQKLLVLVMWILTLLIKCDIPVKTLHKKVLINRFWPLFLKHAVVQPNLSIKVVIVNSNVASNSGRWHDMARLRSSNPMGAWC